MSGLLHFINTQISKLGRFTVSILNFTRLFIKSLLNRPN